MKKIFITGIIIFATLLVSAQNSVGIKFVTAKDSSDIKETILNYVEGYYTADWQRVSRAVHPELAKRIVWTDSTGLAAVNNSGASQLIMGAKRNRKPDNTGEPFRADVVIYDIFKNVATAKVATNKMKFIDYVQLVRINGEWKIINVLWEML